MSAQLCMATARQADFQDRVKYFLQKAALAVMAEDGATVNHADRIAYANKVLSGQTSIDEVSVGITTNSTVAATIASGEPVPDGDLEFCVNSMFDAFAG